MIFNTQLTNTGGMNEWAATTKTYFFSLRIQLPIAVKMLRFQIKCRISVNEQMNNSSLHESKDESIWTNLYSSTTTIPQTI